MQDREQAEKKLVKDFSGDAKKLENLVAVLSEGSRRERQQAARFIAAVAKGSPEVLVPHIGELVDALEHPEAQTRWELLDALTELVGGDSLACEKALVDAETALFDEDSGMLRLAAMRFVCKIGATTESRSEKTWPLIDEAIQCYHGDLEYRDMLALLFSFAHGQISGSVAAELAGRLQFDAENGKGSYLRVRSREIYDALVKRFKLDNPQKKVRAKKSDAEDEDEE